MRTSYERGSLERDADPLQEQRRYEAMLRMLEPQPSTSATPTPRTAPGAMSGIPTAQDYLQRGGITGQTTGSVRPSASASSSVSRNTNSMAEPSMAAAFSAPDLIEPAPSPVSESTPVGTERYGPGSAQADPYPGYVFIQGRGWVKREAAGGLGSQYGTDEQGRPTYDPNAAGGPTPTNATPPPGDTGLGGVPLGGDPNTGGPKTVTMGGFTFPAELGPYAGPGNMEGYSDYGAPDVNNPHFGTQFVIKHLASYIDPKDPDAAKKLSDAMTKAGIQHTFDGLDRYTLPDGRTVDLMRNKEFVKTGQGPLRWSFLEGHSGGGGGGAADGGAGGGGLVGGIDNAAFFSNPTGLIADQLSQIGGGNEFLMALLRQLTQGQAPQVGARE